MSAFSGASGVGAGDASLAHELHAHGYATVRERHPDAAAQERAALERTVAKTAGDKPAQPEAEMAAS